MIIFRNHSNQYTAKQRDARTGALVVMSGIDRMSAIKKVIETLNK